MIDHDPDDEMTILDSQFGKGDAETAFDKMGLPDKKHPDHKKNNLLISAVAVLCVILGIAVLVKMGDAETADPSETAILILQDSIAQEDWKSARLAVSRLPLDHELHKLNPWLEAFDDIQAGMKERDWSKAYDQYSRRPRLPRFNTSDINASIEAAEEEIEKKLVREIKVRDLWLAVNRESVTAVREVLAQTDAASVYHTEISECLRQLEQQTLDRYRSRLKHLLESQEWDRARQLLEIWHETLPSDEQQKWQATYDREWNACRLYERVENLIAHNQLVLAMSALLEAPKQGVYAAVFVRLSESLKDLGDREDVDNAFRLFQTGRFMDGLTVLEAIQSDDQNLALQIMQAHWENVRRLNDSRQNNRRQTPQEKALAVQQCRDLLGLLPQKDGSFRAQIEADLRDGLEEVSEMQAQLSRQLDDRWDEGDYPAVYEAAKKLLTLNADDFQARKHLETLDRVGRLLVDEIYVLKSMDIKLARERLEALSKLLPDTHPLVVSARKLLMSP